MLGVDERGDSAVALRIGDCVQCHGGLTRGFRTVDLDDSATRQSTDAERYIQGDRPGGDDGDRLTNLVTEPHHRSLAEVLVDLR